MKLLYVLALSLMLLANPGIVESSASDNAIYYLIEGVYYLIDQNAPDQAVPFFQKAIASDPANPDPYYFLGVSHYRLGQSIASALFYLYESEQRGIVYDQLRPNLIPEIQRKYPDVQPEAPVTPTPIHEVQIIVESKSEKGGLVVVQYGDGIAEYSLGEQISLEGGKRYTVQFRKKRFGRFFKNLVLVGSVLGIWAIR